MACRAVECSSSHISASLLPPSTFSLFFCACVVLSLRIYSAVVTPFSLCHFPSCFLLPCSALILFQPVSVSSTQSAPLPVTQPSIFSLFIRRLPHSFLRMGSLRWTSYPQGPVCRSSHMLGEIGQEGSCETDQANPCGLHCKVSGTEVAARGQVLGEDLLCAHGAC